MYCGRTVDTLLCNVAGFFDFNKLKMQASCIIKYI